MNKISILFLVLSLQLSLFARPSKAEAKSCYQCLEFGKPCLNPELKTCDTPPDGKKWGCNRNGSLYGCGECFGVEEFYCCKEDNCNKPLECYQCPQPGPEECDQPKNPATCPDYAHDVCQRKSGKEKQYIYSCSAKSHCEDQKKNDTDIICCQHDKCNEGDPPVDNKGHNGSGRPKTSTFTCNFAFFVFFCTKSILTFAS